MKLRDLFDTLTPLFTGQHSHEQTARALYGAPGGHPGQEAWRLALYGRLVRGHRFEVLEKLYPHCARVVRERLGGPAWEALVEAYFQAHPMRRFELNSNGAQLSEFLTRYAPEQGLPAWLPELADLEWWEWEVLVAPDAEASASRPCLVPTVELRPYSHDLVGWLDTEASERAEEPEPREGLVIFWRHEGGFRRENVDPLRLLVIKAVHEGHTLEEVAEEVGVEVEPLEEARAELVAEGILLVEDGAA